MGNTPRQHRFQLPMPTRSTDVSMMQQCPGRWVLTHLRSDDQAEASFFILGTVLHEAIENAIVFDLDEDWALKGMHQAIDRELERIYEGRVVSKKRLIETSKRGFDTMHDDAERMLKQWFWSVHPDSDKRLPIYDEYEWPPKTEVDIARGADYSDTAYDQWGSVDAVFWAHDRESYAIVDWKSGTSRQKTDDQLHFYEYVGSHVGFGIYGCERAWFHHLDKVRPSAIIQTADPYPGDDAVRQRILATEAIKEGIIEDQRVTFNAGPLCNYCPVQHVCPEDGDIRNRDDNLLQLGNLLKIARPMETIER